MVRKRKYLGAAMADADDATEAKTAVSRNRYICHCCERCARKRQKAHLPQEMCFNILLHVPAQVLHDVMRHVCREWNLMIRSQNFIHHHLRNSTSGIIIQEHFRARYAIYVEMRRGCLEICRFDCGFEDLIYTSCNGLVLVPDLKNQSTLYVINPLTKQRVILPPYFRNIGHHAEFGLAFVEASTEYKVVSGLGTVPFGLQKHIVVLTIGVDRVWRRIGIEHLSLTTRGALMYFPLVTGCYIHWIGETFVLTLNLESETVCQFSMPQSRKRCAHFLPMGGNLSVIYESSRFLRDVWEMNPATGEWTRLFIFDLKPLSNRFKGLFGKYEKSIIPLGWLVVREVLIFSTSFHQRHCIAYNVKTGEIQSSELDTYANPYHFQVHVNSLVSLVGGF